MVRGSSVTRGGLVGLGAAVVACVGLMVINWALAPARPSAGVLATAAPTPSGSTVAPLPAAIPPAQLPVVGYWSPPAGFPADPAPLARAPLTEGLQPAARIAAYDAPGGRPRAYLDPTIEGVPITLPIVGRRSGWVSVLLPSVNRTVAWLAPGPWTTVPLRDQLVVVRATHELHWYRDNRLVHSWPVTLGIRATPTPLGRTFIVSRSALTGKVYAGTDVFALGAVPDDRANVPASLRGAHIGLHTWYDDATLGRDATDGCIRLTRSAQQLLLAQLAPGTEVLVVDTLGRHAAGISNSATSP